MADIFFPGEGDVWFSLRNTTYQNNSIVILEDIGDSCEDALNCITNLTACCHPDYTGESGHAIGNWFFPNGTRVLSTNKTWGIYRTRGQMVVRMHRIRGGEEGIYHCGIPDAENVTQSIYIGVYSETAGEWCMHMFLFCSTLVYTRRSINSLISVVTMLKQVRCTGVRRVVVV